jgi:hypothetical protein
MIVPNPFIQAIIRPPRCLYDISDLGSRRLWVRTPSDRSGYASGTACGLGVYVARTDTTIHIPGRGFAVVSEWIPEVSPGSCGGGVSTNGPAGTSDLTSAPLPPPPCVVYCHGNSGSRCDVLYNGVLAHCATRGLAVRGI